MTSAPTPAPTSDEAVVAPADSAPPPRRPAAETLQLEQYFRAMIKNAASDLHLKPGRPPYFRIRTKMLASRAQELTAEETEAMAFQLMTERQYATFIETGSMDMAYELKDSDRFRVNVYRQRDKVAISVRRVTREIPDFKALHLPPILTEVAETQQGLVLLAGPTGCGKSTSIAAMLEHINATRACHVVTIEDPIEYLYDDKKALVNQRELGIDVDSFDSALRALMREDPDVVLIGEMRDRETFQAALQVSETGHLVFGTIHASGASQTLGRILDLFQQESRHLIRQSLAFNLRAVICQKLLPCLLEGIDRVPAVEIMLMNPSIRQLILEERDSEMPEIIRSHTEVGMQSFTQSMFELINKDYVDPKVAYAATPNADELKMLMKGISSGHGGLVHRG